MPIPPTPAEACCSRRKKRNAVQDKHTRFRTKGQDGKSMGHDLISIHSLVYRSLVALQIRASGRPTFPLEIWTDSAIPTTHQPFPGCSSSQQQDALSPRFPAISPSPSPTLIHPWIDPVPAFPLTGLAPAHCRGLQSMILSITVPSKFVAKVGLCAVFCFA